jgi:hypothetical protein
MRSAIYYPSIEVSSPAMMRSALLLWDNLNVIVPVSGHPVSYADPAMAEAWELIGGKIVPNDNDRWEAHQRIEAMLTAGLPVNLQYFDGMPPDKIMELWPDKLSAATWDMLERHKATGKRLANGDYAFEEQAGTAVMAKIADACAGDVFARVTDRMLAFGLLADQQQASADTQVVPMTLELIDFSAIPMDRLIDFRRREATERRGSDYRDMRHAYGDTVQKHADALKRARNQAQRDALNKAFREDMEKSLKDLKSALGDNKLGLVLKPVVVATLVGAGLALAAGTGGAAAALAAGGAAIGTSLPDIAKHIAGMFDAGLGFSKKQREAMAKHPMAYIYQLAQS